MTRQPSQEPPVEQDSRFPSGPWKGFFLQRTVPGRHWMELHLTFREGTIRGEGRDWVGQFIITGRYQIEDDKCWWTKRYVGKHDVAYQGYNEGKGIWGTWQIPPTWRGGFHIWPLAMGDPDTDRLVETLEQPDEVVELVGVGPGESRGE
ncbi:MAG: hypothetical protein HY000_15430 [Planctomycetes bacterium]|nr:hypothetical protein [Planctomycetota bacterium]